MSRNPIGPTPERLAKANGEFEEFTADKTEHWRAIRMLDNHVLEMLLSRGNINGDQYTAGMTYYRDWFEGGLSSSGAIDPGRVVVDGGKVDFMEDKKLAALTKYNAALKSLCDEHADVMRHVVLHEMPISDYGRAIYGHKNPKLSSVAARARLWDALTALDRHYHGKRNMGHRSSHTPDYRPRIIGNDEREVE